MMKSLRIFLVAAILLPVLLITGCATTAQAQFYRPANYSGEPYQITGRFDPVEGWNGVIRIFINDQEVIKKPLPMFTNTTDASGTFEDKKITTTITRVQTFMSSFVRADVFIGPEKAATLTF